MDTKTDPAQVLAQWQADETERRKTMLESGVARPEQVAGLSGMQVFEAMFAGRLPYAPIGDTNDFVLIEATPGRAVFQGRPQLRHYNPLGAVHGGWIAMLLDSCVGCAVHASLPAGKSYTTAELKVLFSQRAFDRFKELEVMIGPNLGPTGKGNVEAFITARDAALRALYSEAMAPRLF